MEKKHPTRRQEEPARRPARAPRRLGLRRETILVLDDPALLGHAKGGKVGGPDTTCHTGSSLPSGMG